MNTAELCIITGDDPDTFKIQGANRVWIPNASGGRTCYKRVGPDEWEPAQEEE